MMNHMTKDKEHIYVEQIIRKIMVISMALTVFMTTICGHISVKAADKTENVSVQYYYMDSDGWREKYLHCYITPGEDKSAILNMLPQVGDADSYCHFKNWNILYGDDIIQGNPDDYYLVEAVYDNYPVGIKKSYIDNTGNVKTVEEKRYYPAGSKYEDILTELEVTPSDASKDTLITGWDVFDPDGYTDIEGTVGPHIDERGVCENDFDLIADYQNVKLSRIIYNFVGDDQKINASEKTICSVKNCSDQDIYDEAMKYAPDNHMKEMEYTGSWKITKNKSDINDSEYFVMLPKYNKIVVEISITDFDLTNRTVIYAAMSGETIAIPDGYVMSKYDETTGDVTYVTTYTVPKDAVDSVYVTWFSKKFIESDSLLERINEANDGVIVEDSIGKNSSISKETFSALKDRDVSLKLSVEGQNATWTINGKSVGNVNEDLNLAVVRSDIDSGNISYDKVSSMVGKRQAEQIAFGYNKEFNFTANLDVSETGLSVQDKAVFVQTEEPDTVKYIDSSKIADSTASFTVDNGNDGVIVYGVNGDTTGDSRIDIRDAMECLKHVSGREDLNAVKQGFADVNFDGTVNIQDLIKEIHVVSGREDTF